jgi:NAD(P)-dependent dehydrogenase (short-subunit alcohol dehydrogenase family)
MTDPRPAVLIIGGSGVFGAHLCRRLARLKLCRILIGGRTPGNAAPLIEELLALDPQCTASFVSLDRASLTSADLSNLGVTAAVDAAGPFQGSSYSLVEAAIGAGVHCIDLCDARAFAAGITAFDARAKASGVAVLTGASSTPALSNAMLRDLTAGWRSIDRIWVSIVPGNKTPRGRAVIAAILSWTGEPVRVFDDGGWQTRHGWSGSRKVSLGRFGTRNAALADTPDLDILVEDFKPRLGARFHAGLELGLMHHGLGALAALRRWRLLPNLAIFTGPMLAAARVLEPFGTDTGAMVVEAEGLDADGKSLRAEARLMADHGHGPVIPSLAAAALLKRIAEGSLLFTGASHAGRHVETGEALALVPDLSIWLEKGTSARAAPLFRRVLGATFEAMPAVTQTLHRSAPAVLGKGEADIDPPETAAGRLISALFRFPKPGRAQPVEVRVEPSGEGERWVRRYPGRDMVSFMNNGDADARTLEERFGPFSFRMEITGHEKGLDMRMVSARMGRLPLPRFLVPEITATERTDERGRHLFDVSISLRLVGKIVHYAGWLTLE